MSHNGKKIFVFLASGDQGRSAVKYLVKDGFEVYGQTRDPTSENAKAIEKLGAHLVKGDLNDVQSYTPALQGMDGVFINADFWSTYYTNGFNAEAASQKEQTQTRAAIDAAVQAKVPHIVYSTLGDLTPDGSEHKGVKYPHHDSKAEVSKYLIKIGAPATHLFTSHYISNCVKFNLIKPQDDGSYLLQYPCPDDTPLPSYAVEQIGLWISAAFKDPKTWIDDCTYAETAAKISKVTGKTVHTQHMSKEFFESDDLKKMVSPELQGQYSQFYHRHIFRDMEQSKKIVPTQWDVTAWAEQSPELEALMHWRKK